MSGSWTNKQGFSLIELLVVLGLMSLITAVAMPGVVNLFEAITRTIEKDDVAIQVNQLGRRVHDTGMPLTLDQSSIELPKGWRLETPQPVYYSANGVCHGGVVQFYVGSELVLSTRLKAPYCRIDDDV